MRRRLFVALLGGFVLAGGCSRSPVESAGPLTVQRTDGNTLTLRNESDRPIHYTNFSDHLCT